jgi:hypothetical protein
MYTRKANATREAPTAWSGMINRKDARALAPDMRTTSEFIGEMRKLAHSTEFACSVRNYTVDIRYPGRDSQESEFLIQG